LHETHAAVQVLLAAPNGQLKVRHSPQTMRQAGFGFAQPVVVTNAEEVYIVQEFAGFCQVTNRLEHPSAA